MNTPVILLFSKKWAPGLCAEDNINGSGQYNKRANSCPCIIIITKQTLTVLVTTIDAQWEGMGDVGSARYEPALLPPCPTIRVLSYRN